jgi:integrase/recombinase XerD
MNIINVGSITAPPPIEELINYFLSGKDVNQSSKDLYKRTLKQFFNWVNKKNYLLSDLTRAELIQYKTDLLLSGKSGLSVGSYITSVRLFYEWLEANKYYPNIAKGVKAPIRKQQFRKQPLTLTQQKELLNYYISKNVDISVLDVLTKKTNIEHIKNQAQLRDYALINLLLRTGLRTIEVIRANIEDIIFKGEQRIILIHGKGRAEKDNFVKLKDKTYLPIKEYLESRPKALTKEPLFTSLSNNSYGKRITTRTIRDITNEGLQAIGIKQRCFTAHSLRHTTAVNILRGGGKLEDAQDTLRHSNPATTQIYTATLKEERRLQRSGEDIIDEML